MGTFARYKSSYSVPEHKRESLARQMSKLLGYGGMMQFEQVSMYGYEINILKPVEVAPFGRVHFHYNYFEDDGWETAGFDADRGVFWTGKIGSEEFHSVVVAAYTLVDLYTAGPGLVLVDGEIVRTDPYIAWINHLLGTSFTQEKRFPLWETAEDYALSRVEDYETAFSSRNLENLIPNRLYACSGGTDFADLCYITKGTETLTDTQVEPGTYPADVLCCKNRLSALLQSQEKESGLSSVWELVQMSQAERMAIKERAGDSEDVQTRLLGEVADSSLILPARVILYLAAELTEQSFWVLWKKLKDKVYHDEVMKDYAPQDLLKMREGGIREPVPGIKTSDFLREDSFFTFFQTPKELKDKPRYYVSDDDRLYWWDGTEEVVISDEMDKWLHELAKRHAAWMEKAEEEVDHSSPDAPFKEFLSLLMSIEDYYKRVFPFQNMFYEFVHYLDRREYQAAILLMREVYEENKEEGAAIQHLNGSWELTSRKVTFNPGRVRMKRLMSVLANKGLREKYFHF